MKRNSIKTIQNNEESSVHVKMREGTEISHGHHDTILARAKSLAAVKKQTMEESILEQGA